LTKLINILNKIIIFLSGEAREPLPEQSVPVPAECSEE
jgi:hypothetical protein